MVDFKDLDYRLLGELFKNSRRSDRELAKRLGSSQPTVTRRRAKIEEELILGYTAVPRWEKLGYEIMAFTFVKTRTLLGPEEQHQEDHAKAIKWMNKQSNIIYAAGCRGMGWDGFMISVHKSYAAFDRFIEQHNAEMSDTISSVDSIIVNLEERRTLKHLDFRYLAQDL